MSGILFYGIIALWFSVVGATVLEPLTDEGRQVDTIEVVDTQE